MLKVCGLFSLRKVRRTENVSRSRIEASTEWFEFGPVKKTVAVRRQSHMP
jgi:hypothetical protein